MKLRALEWLLSACVALCACTGSTQKSDNGLSPDDLRKSRYKGPTQVVDDRTMCEWKGRQDVEVKEVKGPGSAIPNVRRVYQKLGTEAGKRVLVCREMDTNFDGVKDVVRRYNEKGESVYEESDTNFDGRLDTRLTFSKGLLAEALLDTDYDGRPDELKTYVDGKLARIKRDSNRDGKPDVWEIYREGRLERMGVDVDGDERVDRWDHDTEVRRKAEEEERKKEEAAKAEEEKKAAKKREEEAADGDKPKPGGVKGRGKDAAKGRAKDAPKEGDVKGAPKQAPKTPAKGADPKKPSGT